MSANKVIYLDHHATTPVDPRVLEVMLPYFTEVYGNAASIDHDFGYDAKHAVDKAREQIAKAINASMLNDGSTPVIRHELTVSE